MLRDENRNDTSIETRRLAAFCVWVWVHIARRERTPAACARLDAHPCTSVQQRVQRKAIHLMGIANRKGLPCGSFGCPLPNLHTGLCKPCIASRFSRRTGSGASRRGSVYFEKRRQLPFKPKEEFPYHPTYVGPKHQVSLEAIPAFIGGPCVDDRGDIPIRMETKAEVRAHFEAERRNAEAWEVKRPMLGKRSDSPPSVKPELQPPATPLKTVNANTASTSSGDGGAGGSSRGRGKRHPSAASLMSTRQRSLTIR